MSLKETNFCKSPINKLHIITCFYRIPSPPDHIFLLCNDPVTIFHEDPYSDIGIITLINIFDELIRSNVNCHRYILRSICKKINSHVLHLYRKVLKVHFFGVNGTTLIFGNFDFLSMKNDPIFY